MQEPETKNTQTELYRYPGLNGVVFEQFTPGSEAQARELLHEIDLNRSEEFSKRAPTIAAIDSLHQALDAIAHTDDGMHLFAMRLEASSALIGLMTIFVNDEHHSATIGYFVTEDERGQGRATEAVQATLDFLFSSAIESVSAAVYEDIGDSITVLRKNGFKKVNDQLDQNRLNDFGLPSIHYIYEITRGDYLASRSHGEDTN